MKKEILPGILHTVPTDIEKTLNSNEDLLTIWNSLTPIARNEWICWTTIVKKPETRIEHIVRLESDLLSGRKRPCCWPGCPHRRPKAGKWFPGLEKEKS